MTIKNAFKATFLAILLGAPIEAHALSFEVALKISGQHHECLFSEASARVFEKAEIDDIVSEATQRCQAELSEAVEAAGDDVGFAVPMAKNFEEAFRKNAPLEIEKTRSAPLSYFFQRKYLKDCLLTAVSDPDFKPTGNAHEVGAALSERCARMSAALAKSIQLADPSVSNDEAARPKTNQILTEIWDELSVLRNQR